jgi:GntR family transcriptional regulator/MocR family aminotransferase
MESFESAGARILPVNVDKDGLITDEVAMHYNRVRRLGNYTTRITNILQQ